jgi:hypothetical protein
MPYVTKPRRLQLDAGDIARSAGDLNYKITQLCREFIKGSGHTNYTIINEVIGVLECAKQEFYRRIAVPYENKKIKVNGDVYK